ncbi:bactofilin family protein [Mongoliibacter ruber]|uniref:Cytoskeletal protein CcmA (Bactofilin family) n=1 Tax=Mongoliibacter ruber TaxID=1750599 RepID=A0A2T0WR91_9BACT|nr:polymer-forming cytoskeletal protein [Mongoliibacter ruber]PRY89219.1 cytoskeletal protein CcmA (bactofilin family) [Mongoliibacter ruber]
MFSKPEEKKSVVDMVNSSNVISRETHITGDITAQGNIRIEGTVDGMVKSTTKVVIGDSAIIRGNITSKEAEISGKIEGEVICSELLFLKKSAIINGNISTQKLVVENGAIFNGKCQMNSNSLTVSKSKDKEDSDKKQFAAG